MFPKLDLLKNTSSNNFFLIAGPCVVESEKIVFETAEKLKSLTDKFQVPLIFKSSYRKANRTSINSFTGIGDETALEILLKVREQFQVPVLTDIHESIEAEMAAEYIDVLQIPAFLSRQTDLLIAAAKTGKCINIKKGQFMNGEAMKHAIQKVRDAGNENVFVTDRGNSFGYQDLIVDYRNIPLMQKFGVPVVMDCTHSLQKPNQTSGITGGDPEMIETIARAAIAVGADGLFIETHPNPAEAKSDGANMLKLDKMESLLRRLIRIREAVKN
jgi:2-dehydro-3-deoxyphosphooctonate aldolase (KDO 8-P synthase)